MKIMEDRKGEFKVKQVEEVLLDLLEKYHHYKFMTNRNPFSGWFAGMNIGDFMQWLKSRE